MINTVEAAALSFVLVLIVCAFNAWIARKK